MKLLLSFLTFFACFFQLQAQILTENPKSINTNTEFGKYLLQSGQYELAALEFERLNYFNPQNDTVRTLLLKAYRLGGQPINGLNHSKIWFPWLFDDSVGSIKEIRIEVYKEVCAMFLDLDSAALLLHATQKKYMANETVELYQTNMHAGAFLLMGQWDQARNVLNNCNNCHPQLMRISNLATYDLKYKSPSLAMLCSAIVPGSGKVYAGKWKDGLFSLLFVASNAYASYRGFQRDGIGSAYGWIFGSLGTGFYLGNIYGSGQAAKGFNQAQFSEIKYQTLDALRNLD